MKHHDELMNRYTPLGEKNFERWTARNLVTLWLNHKPMTAEGLPRLIEAVSELIRADNEYIQALEAAYRAHTASSVTSDGEKAEGATDES